MTPPAGLDETEIMTVRQIAEYLNCHPATVARMLRVGKLPGFRLGLTGGWRFRRSEINRWISNHQMKPEHASGRKRRGRPRKVG